MHSAVALDANKYYVRLALGGGMKFAAALNDNDCSTGSLIAGASQTAAVHMSIKGAPSRISVATTQVNLEDSSTDTVVWPVE